MPIKLPRVTSRNQSNSSQSFSLQYLLILLASAVLVGTSLYLYLQRPSTGISSDEIAERLENATPPPVSYVDATELHDQFRDCIKVSTPENSSLEDLLPGGEYQEYSEKFDRSIRTAVALSNRTDAKIGSCTGVDRIYELKKLIEQRCSCKLDIICSC